MKICPTCKKSYADDGLNFCLDDGSVLNFANSNLPETVMMNQPLPTSPSSPFGTEPTSPAGWKNNQQFSMQPPVKKSKTWLWLLGIFGIGLVLCGGGGLLFIGVAIYNAPDENPPIGTASPTPTPTGQKSPTTGPSPIFSSTARKIDLSSWTGSSEHGSTTFSGGELTMSAAKQGYYYAICAADTDKTENATVRVSVKNINSGNTNSGYGLIFNSNPTPLQQGYALLLDSTKKRYRVVRHKPREELVVVDWTASDAIKAGSEINKLEVKHKDDINEIFINDKKVTSVRNTFGFKGGVTGLYAADGIKIGFTDLEIEK